MSLLWSGLQAARALARRDFASYDRWTRTVRRETDDLARRLQVVAFCRLCRDPIVVGERDVCVVCRAAGGSGR